MQKDQLASFITLYHCVGIGRVSLIALAEQFSPNFNQIFELNRSELKAAGLGNQQVEQVLKSERKMVEQEIAWSEQPGNYVICYDDDDYPPLLKEIPDYPPLLYCSGDIELLKNPQVAIVGSRKCTPGGARTARNFAATLAQAGLTITSGMAVGIDSQAHLGALSCGGKTIAVTGTGLDRIYPSQNKQLAYDIHENGLLVSEFPLGTGPNKENFPRRNRIISGLSVATVIVEATRRSGSLITARQALEQGREVFAIPGSIQNPQARGCHQLIREGATLVDQTSDIIEELGSLLGFIAEHIPPANEATKSQLSQESIDLLDTIGYDPVSTDVLIERSGLTINKLSSMLLLLELNDLIESAPGGCYIRI